MSEKIRPMTEAEFLREFFTDIVRALGAECTCPPPQQGKGCPTNITMDTPRHWCQMCWLGYIQQAVPSLKPECLAMLKSITTTEEEEN